MNKRAPKAETTPVPAGCWHSPRGKLLSAQDQILLQLPGEDLSVLRRLVDASMVHIDEARGTEQRVPFAARLVRIQEQKHDKALTVERADLSALHQALHVAAGHVDDDLIRGSDTKTDFIKRLVRIRNAVIDAVCDHDDVPKEARYYGSVH